LRVATSLLLASNSPRRRELLTAAGFRFGLASPGVEERFDANLTLVEVTTFNALRKGLTVARSNPGKVVLAADTLVALDGEVIGKPEDLEAAAGILRRLSGRVHDVCSSVFVCHLAAGRSNAFHEISRVRFKRLDSAAIDRYLTNVNPLDKAGAYAAQGDGAKIIDSIEGSFTNVVGLPMKNTTAVLAQFGIMPATA
jgi:septum formation protein